MLFLFNFLFFVVVLLLLVIVFISCLIISVILGHFSYGLIRKMFERPMTPEELWAETCEEIKTNSDFFVADRRKNNK